MTSKQMGSGTVRKAMLAAVALAAAVLLLCAVPGGAGSSGGAYADTPSAPGGTVASNNSANALEAFGPGNVTASYSGKTLAISLSSDVELNNPVRFTRGSADDTVELNLNGHALTVVQATSGTDMGAANGKNAIEIVAADYNVVIRGAGSITGGKGAVYESESHFRTGMRGGDAVCFVTDEGAGVWSPQGGKLEHGLTVTGGAVITGGKGADVASSDWLYNIGSYTGGRGPSAPRFEAGSAGSGIGQDGAGTLFSSTTLVYTKIIVDDGVVAGGTGGNVDMTSFAPTYYALMTSDAAASAMNGYDDNSSYDTRIGSMSGKYVGAGGDGIKVGCGRKYIEVGTAGEVRGSGCGVADFGRNKYINRLGKGFSDGDAGISVRAGDAGDGIAVWVSDIGLTDVAPSYTKDEWQSEWDTKTKDSDDMGIYIKGTVTGGSAPDATALSESAGDGGAGLALYGDADRYGADPNSYPISEDSAVWGIVCIDENGLVKGGDGGNAVAGFGGSGGEGILENYSVEYGDYGTNYYIVNGTVAGGDGGHSLGVSDLSEAGVFQSGGNGLSVDNYRKNMLLSGSGVIKAGDAGKAISRGGTIDVSDSSQDAVYAYGADDSNFFDVATQDGAQATVINKGSIPVTASMSSFSDYPTTSTTLSCTYAKPADYTGGVYVCWFVSLRLQSNDMGTHYIEPSGTNGASFNLRSNAQYKYLAYPGSYFDQYNLYVATVDRINETIQYNNSTAKVYCYIMLEDGRWGKSNEMTITKNGWNGGGSGGGQSQEQIDQAAADAVAAKIEALPPSSQITLADASAVAAARAAYESLTDSQKAMLAPYVYLLDDLEAAEAKIASLRTAIDEVEGLINALPDTSGLIGSGNDEAVAAARGQIEEALEAYGDLTPEQQSLVDNYAELEAAEAWLADLTAFEMAVYLIGELPEPELIIGVPTIVDDVVEARIAYDELSDEIKALFPDDATQKLLAVEEALRDSGAAYEAALVTHIIEQLPAAGALKLSDKQQVQAAQAAFDELDEDQKSAVSATVKAQLDAAVARIDELQRQADEAARTLDASRSALASAITAAKNAKAGIVTSAKGDGSDVADGKKWTTKSELTALNNAITAAQKVYDNKGATKAQIDAATTAVKKATSTYNLAKKLWHRIWGATAPDTMQKIASRFGKTSVAVVTTDASYKDALAASALAGKYNGLVLMTKKGSLTSQTKAALKAAGVKTVYIVGSTGNVSAKVASQLKSGTGVTKVTRVAGSTPSQRAVAAAKVGGKKSDTVIIATQNGFQDALSIAPYSYATKSPILYAETNKKLSAATLKYIKSAKYKKAIIVGGPVALPASIDTQLTKQGGIKKANITRIAGLNAYSTSQLIAKWTTGKQANGNVGKYKGKVLAYFKFKPSVTMKADKLAVSTGQNWLDALAGAALCGKNKSVLLLADAKTSKSNYTLAPAWCKTNKAQIKTAAYVFGGTSAVQAKVWTALVNSTK